MNKIRKFIYDVLSLFLILGILFIPFSFRITQIQSKITQRIFEDAILQFTSKFCAVKIVNAEITSDALSMYILIIFLMILAVLFAIVLNLIDVTEIKRNYFISIIQIIFVFYLAIIMFKYGFDKIFRVQFYSPEPNILYTPLGFLDKDILYWSTIGASYSYSFFIGILEVIPALLLLFRKTRILGLIILLGVLVHVLAINLCFDISVKIFSSFLLLLVVFLLLPTFKSLFQFFILGKHVKLSTIPIYNSSIPVKSKLVLKVVFVVITFFECLYPNLKNTKNDSKFKLYGAFEVIDITDLTSDKIVEKSKIKRVFFHQQNYFIVQYQDDSTEDFYFESNRNSKEFTIINYNGKRSKVVYNFSKFSGKLDLEFIDINIRIHLKVIDWKKLPLLQPQFHWTVDEVQ